jgi:NAD(P) transhydrogenase subunit alpha
MEIAVLRERYPMERRVALDPTHLPHLAKLGCTVRVESGAGEGAGWSDDDYRSAGARIESDRARLLDGARCVLKVRPPQDGTEGGENEVALLQEGTLLVCFLTPGASPALLDALAARGVSAMAMERMPRTTRAQRMDALSSQATAAGYHAVLLAATQLPRFFPMLTTAAGTIRPAKGAC